MRSQFSRHSKLSKILQISLQNIRKLVSAISALILIAALVLPFAQVTRGNAQNELSFIRKVAVIGADEIGLTNPTGISFSAKDKAFHVADSRQVKPNDTDLVKVTPLSARAGLAQIAAKVQNPINMVFDNRFNRLLLLPVEGSQILAVRPDNSGNLKPLDVTRYNVKGLGLQDPQGMAVDEETGTLFILDAGAQRVLQIQPSLDGNFEGANLSEINLQSYGFSSLRGIAFEPSSDHFFVNSPTDQKLYEVTSSGELTATRDLAQFGLKDPQSIVFAPSGDQTDDPAEMSLYVADSGLVEGQNSIAGTDSQSTGQIVELSLTALAEPAAATLSLSLIRTTDMAAISPPSPDPSGIAYLSNSNTLLIVDGEVEETVNTITHFQGANVWELTLLGDKVRTANISTRSPTVTAMSNEPTGVAWNPNNGHYYVTDDGSRRVYDLNPGGDGLIGTSDDSWTFFSTSIVGSGDPEGITFNTQNGHLFVADGHNAEVYEFTIDGTLVNQFDVQQYGVIDPEGIEFIADTGTLFTMSSNKSTPVIAETTADGTLLQTISIAPTNAAAAAGLAYGPASDGSGAKRFYIVDRGIDNNDDPNIIDGKLYELAAPSFGPTLTPTSTFTPGPSPTPTNTLTPTPTSLPSGNPFYVSFASGGSVGGVSFADEDILKFDGFTWSLFFDGSDVGLGAADVFAFHPLDQDSFLLAFLASVTVGGQTYAPTDIVRFDASSVGATTAGTFSLYFHGIDVGLDTTSENIDAIDILSDGRLLISTTGNPTVPGLSGLADEDILAFTPTSLGATTSGSWAWYFDGSDVALGSSSEDIDALDVGSDGAIYLSTLGDFAVTGIAGFDEDIFVCSPTSLGSVTACNFSSTLFFAGSSWGLSANDVDAFHLLESGTFPTATPTNTPTETSTPSQTATATNTTSPTSTPTIGPSPTPTNTPTPTATSISTNTPTPGPSLTPTNTNTPDPTSTATPTSSVADLIFKDGFESGNFSAWSANSNNGGNLSVSAGAALEGNYGLQAAFTNTANMLVRNDSPTAETRYRARFYFNPNSISMATGDNITLLQALDASGNFVLSIQFNRSSAGYQLRARSHDSGSGVFVNTPYFIISNAVHTVEIDWGNDGHLTFWIDGVQQANLTGINNSSYNIETVRLGAPNMSITGTSGSFYIDAFESRRFTYIGP
jgi:sugar lactone lactonase YvrE